MQEPRQQAGKQQPCQPTEGWKPRSRLLHRARTSACGVAGKRPSWLVHMAYGMGPGAHETTMPKGKHTASQRTLAPRPHLQVILPASHFTVRFTQFLKAGQSASMDTAGGQKRGGGRAFNERWHSDFGGTTKCHLRHALKCCSFFQQPRCATTTTTTTRRHGARYPTAQHDNDQAMLMP